MKKQDIPCEIIQDLLPSYIEELTSEVTTEAVKHHLDSCKDCNNVYRRMTGMEEDLPIEHEEDARDAEEINFLKKSHKNRIKSVLLAIGGTALCLIACLFIKCFIIGQETSPQMVMYQIQEEDGTFYFSGSLLNSANVISSVKFKEDGDQLYVTVRDTFVSPFCDYDYDASYKPDQEIHTVYMNGQIIWQNGKKISPQIGRLYDLRTPYVGDPSAVDVLASTLSLYSYLGDYTMELQTKEEPYGCTFIAEQGLVIDSVESDVLQKKLPKYGTLLIALIDNLGQVEFQYEKGGRPVSILVTQDDAEKMYGGRVKDALHSPYDLQEMVEKLSVYSYELFGESLADVVDDTIRLNLVNQADDEYYAYDVSMMVNGESVGGQGSMNANNDSIIKGDTFLFEFIPEDYDVELEEGDQISFTISVTDKDGKSIGEMEIPIELTDPAYYDGTCYSRNLTVTGNKKDGYHIED